MDAASSMNVRFQKIFSEVLPLLHSELSLVVSPIIKDLNKRGILAGTTGVYKCASFQYEIYGFIHDKGDKKYYLFEVYLSVVPPKSLQPFLEDFFQYILHVITEQIVDYRMIEDISNGSVSALNHLFLKLENREHHLATHIIEKYVEGILHDQRLPEMSVITQFAAQMYEKRPMYGTIIFITRDMQQECILSEEFLSLKSVSVESRKINIRNFREIRKLMEINSKDTCMVAVADVDSGLEPALLGIASKSWMEHRNEKLKKYPQFTFQGYLKWTYSIDGNKRFSCDNGVIKLYLEGGLEKGVEEKLKKAALDNSKRKNIIEIIGKLKEERHGTSVVFMEQEIAKEEAERLGIVNRCIRIKIEEHENVDLRSLLTNIKGITSIDGAILADLEGRVYAVGAILDGKAEKSGKVSRGARFNSVDNYLFIKHQEYKTANMFGVVVSEDSEPEILIPEENTRTDSFAQ